MRWLSFLLILTSFITSFEFSIVDTIGISLEVAISIFIFFIIIIKYFNPNRTENNQPLEVFFILLSLAVFFLIKDLLHGNYRSFYSINFLLLLLSLTIFHSWGVHWKNLLLSILVLTILIKGFFFPEYTVGTDYLDDPVLGRIQRLRIQGFESNSTGTYLALLITFLILQIKPAGKIFHKITIMVLIALLFILILKTFSRAALLSIIIAFLFYFRKHKTILFASITLFSIGLVFILNQYNIYDLVVTRFENILNLNNPRLFAWQKVVSEFILVNFPFNFLLGLGFFKHAIDNTYLNIFVSYGIIGGPLFIYYLVKYSRYYFNQRTSLLFIVFAINIFFIEAFAQKKIIIVLSFLTYLLNSKKSINEYSSSF